MSSRTVAVAIECVVNEAPSDALLACFFLDPVSLAIGEFGKETGESETLANQHRNGRDHNQQRHGQTPEQVTSHRVELIV